MIVGIFRACIWTFSRTCKKLRRRGLKRAEEKGRGKRKKRYASKWKGKRREEEGVERTGHEFNNISYRIVAKKEL